MARRVRREAKLNTVLQPDAAMRWLNRAYVNRDKGVDIFGIDPLFDYLTNKETNAKFSGDIKWNYNKFLVGKNGEVLARFEPQVEPTSAEVKQAVEKALAS